MSGFIEFYNKDGQFSQYVLNCGYKQVSSSYENDVEIVLSCESASAGVYRVNVWSIGNGSISSDYLSLTEARKLWFKKCKEYEAYTSNSFKLNNTYFLNK